MSVPSNPISPITNDLIKTQQSEQAQSISQASAVQETIKEDMQSYVDQFSVNTMQIIRRNSEPLEERARKRVKSDSQEKRGR